MFSCGGGVFILEEVEYRYVVASGLLNIQVPGFEWTRCYRLPVPTLL